MTRLKVGICELRPEMAPGSEAWSRFARHVSMEKPDLFLLNEMPFGSWISAGEKFAPETWKAACDMHAKGVSLLGELGANVVLGSRARELEGRRVNEAFVWTKDDGLQGIHTKQFFPNEAGYYEARWFEPGERHFQVVEAGSLKVGFLICTEVMFNELARHYGRSGAHVIAVPRATPRGTTRRWLTAMQMAANRVGLLCGFVQSRRSRLAGSEVRRRRLGRESDWRHDGPDIHQYPRRLLRPRPRACRPSPA